MILPRIIPMPLTRLDRPFDHPGCIFELKLDSFFNGSVCRLVSHG
jgi:hypothetical protein